MRLNIKNGIIQDNDILGAKLKRDITPMVTRKHRPGTKSKKKKSVIHNADNVSRTATAQAHANLLKNMEKQWPNHSMSRSQVSWHFAVDDKEIIQCIPTDEIAYCQGNALGNLEGISIEICDNMYNVDKSRYLKAEENAAKLAAALNETLGLTSVQHNYYTGKNCPSKIRKEGRWNSYLKKIDSYKGKSNGNVNSDTSLGDDGFMSKFGGLTPMVVSTLKKFEKDDDYIDAVNLVKEKFYPSYNPLDTVSGEFDYAGLSGKVAYIIGIGGELGNHSSTINYHIPGETGKEVYDNVIKFRQGGMDYLKKNYIVKGR